MQDNSKMIISIRELEQAREECLLLNDIRREIEASYNTYHSPLYNGGCKTSRNTGSPVSVAINNIEGLREKYERIQSRLIAYQDYVTNRISDPLIESLIVLYYFCGKSWIDSGIPDGKKRVKDYIRKNKKELNSDEHI